MTTTQELIDFLEIEKNAQNGAHKLQTAHMLMLSAQRLRELEALLAAPRKITADDVTDEQISFLTERHNDTGDSRYMAVVDRLRELDKPDCIYTLCADDSPTPNTLESGCDGAVLWYLGDDGKGKPPRFCHHCGGAVISGGLAND